MKRIFILLAITISLLACIGITYAASYVNPGDGSLFEEGDIFILSSGSSGQCVDAPGSYASSYCIPLNDSQSVNYYVPYVSADNFDFCNLIQIESQDYNEDRTFVVPSVEGREYIWSTYSFPVNCTYGQKYYKNEFMTAAIITGDINVDLNFFALPKLGVNLECDEYDLTNTELISCRVKVNGYANSSIKSLSFQLLNEGVKVQDVVMVKDDLRYTSYSSYGLNDRLLVNQSGDSVRFHNDTLMTFNIKIDSEDNDLSGNNITRSIKISDFRYYDEKYRDGYSSISEDVQTINFSYTGSGNVNTEPDKVVTVPDDIATNPDDVVTDSDDNDIVNNPKTGYLDYIVLLIGVLIISGVCLYVVKNKELVENIEK